MVLLLVVAGLVALSAHAQTYQGGQYDGTQTRRLGYGYKTFPSKYYGIRVGFNCAHIASKTDGFGCDMRARLNLGAVVGYGLTASTPLYLEAGVLYSAKGGKKRGDSGKKDFNLNYIEIPFVLKYRHTTDGGFGFQPFFGGYLAYGISGSIKDYATETSYGAFGNRDEADRRFNDMRDFTAYRRVDAGLRFGLGVSYEVGYIEFAYDLGLSNISHDSFNPAHNRDYMFVFGVNF